MKPHDHTIVPFLAEMCLQPLRGSRYAGRIVEHKSATWIKVVRVSLVEQGN